MTEMNFYFTGILDGKRGLKGNNESRYFSREIDQNFFKEILERKLKHPRLFFSRFQEIGSHLAPFYKSGAEHLETDISGIIIPICHGDINEYFHMAGSIPGDFERDLEKIWIANNITERYPEDPLILMKRGNLTEEFMQKVFPIPVFRSYEHIPGYRKDNSIFDDKLHYVEDAFEKWVTENFVKG